VEKDDAGIRFDSGSKWAEAFHVRGRFLTAIAIRIESKRPDASFFAALDEKIKINANLLIGAPIVLDLEAVPGFVDGTLLQNLIDAIRSRGMLLFGVQNASAEQRTVAEKAGLIPVLIGRDAPTHKVRTEASGPMRSVKRLENKVIRRHIRSGQMIVAERGDLTIIGSVASGAEVVASGNIHIYGTLRGRAMAGANGDESARIFCSKLEAELLAVAGLFKTSETINPDLRSRNVQIFLEDETLRIERFL
jgi:septum site-determining protein MinC